MFFWVDEKRATKNLFGNANKVFGDFICTDGYGLIYVGY